MKKITTFWMITICLFSLAACADRGAGVAAEPAPSENRTEEAYIRIMGTEGAMRDDSPGEFGETPDGVGEQAYSDGEPADNVGEQAYNDGEPADNGGEPTDNGKEPAESLVTYETVYEAENVCLEVSLPATWEYRIKTVEDLEKEDGEEVCAIEFWPEAFPEAVFELGYFRWLGICGTGVTTERMELTSGLTGYRHYESYEADDSFWTAIFFDRPEDETSEGVYVILASPGLSVWERIEPEFEKILNSVRVGYF